MPSDRNKPEQAAGLVVHDEQEAAELLASLTTQGKAYLPIGRGSRLGFGAPVQADTQLVSFAALDRMTRFAPDDLTCGVQVGMTLEALLTEIEAHGLTLEPGPFARQQERTIGGLFAEAPPSSRGHDRASLRSQLIGLRAVDGHGRIFQSGGQVVKNVAGYDLCKLFVASGGAYFAALEVQLRLVPLPAAAVLATSESMPRKEAVARWLELRRETPELRACDLVFEKAGSARVEYLLAGAPALVTSLSKLAGFSVLRRDLEAWHTPAEDIEQEPCLLRGRCRVSALLEFAEILPKSCEGRIAYQGAFWLGCERVDLAAFSAQHIIKPIRGMPAVTSPTAKFDGRIAEVFGGFSAPTRSSFDSSRSTAASANSSRSC